MSVRDLSNSAEISGAAAQGWDRILAGLHVILWWLAASTLHTAPMPTMVEELARGAEGLGGFVGMPPLAGLLLDFFWTAAGYTGIALLAALPAAAFYIVVWRLGLRLAGIPTALAGVLASVGLYHLTWATPDFGPHALLTPIWIGAVFAFREALDRPFLLRWLLLGFIAAIALYASFLGLALLAAMMVWMIVDPAARSLLRSPGPWLAIGIAILGFLPLAIGWAGRPGTAGALGDALASLPIFVGALIAFMVPVAVLLGIGGCRPGPRLRPTFLGVLLAVPILAAILGAVVLGKPLALSSAGPLLCLAGIWLASHCTPLAKPRWLIGAALVVLVAVPVAWALNVQFLPRFTGKVPEVRWPQRAIARGVESVSRVEAGDAPRIIAGNAWLAGLAALTVTSSDQGRGRPKVLIDGDRRLSPYVEDNDLAGVVAIVAPLSGELPLTLNELWRSRGAPGFQRLTFPWPGFTELPPLQLRVAILPPAGGGNKLAGRVP